VIPLFVQILIALLFDALCGDPRWFPHPVKGIGWLALTIEEPLRHRCSPRIAGIVAVVVVVAISTVLTWGVCVIAAMFHPLLGDLVTIIMLYSCFAVHDLRYHALAVYTPLVAGDVETARKQVAMLVGRDTDKLDEAEVTRAVVESVAENTVDGVTAPLLFAFVAGAPGAMFYKAVNTLDSTFGYKNKRYLQFGWAAARFDDLINFLPARLTGILIPIAAWLIKLDGAKAWQIFLRDRLNHPSPNGGQSESAFAGALGVRLGGLNCYADVESNRPLMGDAGQVLQPFHIKQAVNLMLVVSFVFVIMAGVLSWIL